MKAITLHVAALAALEEPVAQTSLSTKTPESIPPKIHGQMLIKKIKTFGNSSTHTRLTNKQMVKRKRKLKRQQRQRIQAR